MRKRVGHIGRVPVHDRGDDEVETGGAVLLGFVATIDDTALPERADGLRKGMTLLAFVQSGLATLAQCRILQPIQHEQGPLDFAHFLKGDIKLVLTLVGSELSQHGRRCDVARFQRGYEPQHIIPMLTDNVRADPFSEKGHQVG